MGLHGAYKVASSVSMICFGSLLLLLTRHSRFPEGSFMVDFGR